MAEDVRSMMDCVEHWLAPARREDLLAHGVNAASIVVQLAFYSACRFFRTVMIVAWVWVQNPQRYSVVFAQFKTEWFEVFNYDMPRGFRAAAAATQVT
jgi:hypothetical protein